MDREAFKCEVCGQRADIFVNDLQELEPERDESGNYWKANKVVARHAYCLKHHRKGIVYPRED